jgi:hypothetical protein
MPWMIALRIEWQPKADALDHHANQIGDRLGHLRLRPILCPLYTRHRVIDYGFKLFNSIWLPKARNLRVPRCD